MRVETECFVIHGTALVLLNSARSTDNKAACDVIKYPGATKRTLHFDRWLHFAREMCLHNRIEIFLTGTDNMMADGFTKPVDKTKFIKCRDYILTKAQAV